MPCQHLPATIDDAQALLAGAGYVAGRGLATVVFLALKLGRPLFLEGEAGVGKTEIAKALSPGARPAADPPAVLRGARRRPRRLRVELPGADGGDPHRRGGGRRPTGTR